MTNITTELAEALRGVLTAHKSRQPATVMQAEAELDAIRQAADKARAALARYDSLPRPEGVPELPEPAFRLRWHAADARYTVSKPNIGDTDVFTAEQVQTAYAAGLAAQPQGEPVATLHDDGCFTWKRDEFRLRFDRQRAGWRMDVYAAAPPSQPPTPRRKEPDMTTILPDGSALGILSLPLPADHWLYAPRGEWDSVRDDFAETPHPILTHAQRDAVVAAVRYAIRGATMCGKEMDFDPDALVQNAVYALCGPFGCVTEPAKKEKP